MRDKLESIIDRYNTIEILMTDQETLSNPDKLKELAREYKQLEQVVITGSEYIKILDQITECELIIDTDDSELKDLAVEDLELSKKRKIELEDELKIKLLPKDPMDNKNIILEIRAGTGGDEAALFAADLFRLYSHFSEKYSWEKELIASNEIGIGGFKEVIISLKGSGAYGMLKYESGVHRVQRVPETETGGRVHTSAATVAVLPEAEETDLEINDSDLKIDTYRASGAGGQHDGETDSGGWNRGTRQSGHRKIWGSFLSVKPTVTLHSASGLPCMQSCRAAHHFCPRDHIGACGIRRSCWTSALNASSSMSSTLRSLYTVPSVGSCLVGTNG